MNLTEKDEKLNIFRQTMPLAERIRLSFVIIEIPLIILMLVFFYNLWRVNAYYESMIESVSMASGFSLDFKKDFDYETYLLIAGNTTVETSELQKLLSEAGETVAGLEELNETGSRDERLNTIKKYLKNLATYKRRIENNIKEGDKYEENIEIWENDVQIVTQLLQESVYEYIYYEVKELQNSSESLRRFYVRVLGYSMAAFLVIITITALLSWWIPRSITKPATELYEVTQKVAAGDLTVRSHIDAGVELSGLSESMNSMLDRIADLMAQVRLEQINLSKAEFELLQAQINPHFLYNTLDAIVWLAESGEQEKVVEMVGSLSEFFRVSLSQGRDIITLKEEIRHVRSYLSIQQVRYQDILRYEIDVPADMDELLIPKITIQPLAENALYHGIKNKRGGGTIRITGGREENGFYICVEDDGIGMNSEELAAIRDRLTAEPKTDEGGYALYNVNARIRLHFGAGSGLAIESSEDEGTRVTAHIRYLLENTEENLEGNS